MSLVTHDRVTWGVISETCEHFVWVTIISLSPVSFLDLSINEETASALSVKVLSHTNCPQPKYLFSCAQACDIKPRLNVFQYCELINEKDVRYSYRKQAAGNSPSPRYRLFRLEYLSNSFSKQTMSFNEQINSCSVYQKNAREQASQQVL